MSHAAFMTALATATLAELDAQDAARRTTVRQSEGPRPRSAHTAERRAARRRARKQKRKNRR